MEEYSPPSFTLRSRALLRLKYYALHESRCHAHHQTARAEPHTHTHTHTHTLSLSLSSPAGGRAINNRQSASPLSHRHLILPFRTLTQTLRLRFTIGRFTGKDGVAVYISSLVRLDMFWPWDVKEG